MTFQYKPRITASRAIIIGVVVCVVGLIALLSGIDQLATAATKYTCPMHPEIIQEGPGKCPICKMDLEPVATPPAVQAEPKPALKGSMEIEKWQCPMHPSIIRDHPGDCPICGMSLVKVSVGGGAGASQVSGRGEVSIDPARQQLIGVRTAPVTSGLVGESHRFYGRVEANPTKVRKVNVKVNGYVEEVFAGFIGKAVSKGDPLFTIYSPDIYAAQLEYLQALAIDSATAEVVKRKLELWDMSKGEIEQLEAGGKPLKAITLFAPSTGVISAKAITIGSPLSTGDVPYEITSLSDVWVMAEGYEEDIATVEVGEDVQVTFDSIRREVVDTKIDFIEPTLDLSARTFRFGVVVFNSEGTLKPGMFTTVTVQNKARMGLTIPADAILPSGRGFYVFVHLQDGKFQPREVRTGAKSGDRIEVVDGLTEGEEVVTRANFLIDSESSLRAALQAAVEK